MSFVSIQTNFESQASSLYQDPNYRKQIKQLLSIMNLETNHQLINDRAKTNIFILYPKNSSILVIHKAKSQSYSRIFYQSSRCRCLLHGILISLTHNLEEQVTFQVPVEDINFLKRVLFQSQEDFLLLDDSQMDLIVLIRQCNKVKIQISPLQKAHTYDSLSLVDLKYYDLGFVLQNHLQMDIQVLDGKQSMEDLKALIISKYPNIQIQ
ncbi:hypothetical protein SS50377_22508 [Spironucleus salmonicida]|uniref:Uncharacterized protein n=1 Tax=Spironucleus salmonicida TaxID=348837 RepID=A0A9P8LV21_9EUKA|nr:hypothetical protein SS50377_22508 [Spironucleus salmonicida]